MISGGLGMEFDFFFNVFGREDEWNQIIILITCYWVIEINLNFILYFNWTQQ